VPAPRAGEALAEGSLADPATGGAADSAFAIPAMAAKPAVPTAAPLRSLRLEKMAMSFTSG
jgi:hypothetical protein